LEAITAPVGSESRDAPVNPLRGSLRAALPAWLVSRAIVLATVSVALWVRGGDMLAEPWRGAKTLVIWDAVVYSDLAEKGYLAYGPKESRFFPLLPMLVRGAHLLGLPVTPVLTAVCWVAALAFAAALHRLVLLETGDGPSARRAAWLIQLVPGANVLVLGYAEALAGALTVAFFILLRTRRNLAMAGPVGVLCGLVRPTGLLLSVPALIELARPGHGLPRPARPEGDGRSKGGGSTRWPLRALVVAAPVAGTVGYLAWCWNAYGQALAPYHAQTDSDLRGGVFIIDPRFLVHTSGGGYPWPLVLVLLAAAGVLLWICARRLPASYTVWSVVTVATAVTAYGFHSLPRYLASVFPLIMAAALVCRNRLVWRSVLMSCIAVFALVSYLNFIPFAVP
jgi:hypothetical protein